MHKIVIINNWLISGGAEKQGLILAKTLNSQYKVYLCIYYSHRIEDKFLKDINENNIELILLRGNHFSKLLNFYHFCKREKVSIIISYLFVGNVINSIVGSILKIKHRIGGIRNSKHSLVKNYIQRFLHNNLLTLSISNSHEGEKECIKFGYIPQKLMVIHNCFEFNDVDFKNNDNQIVRVITVARFVEQKDYLTSIKAIRYALNKSNNKNIRYIIIGYGKLENKIRRWINEYDLQNNITIIINPKDINRYLSESDIYLSTSLYEGLSNSIMEGMSYSLPIIATSVGDNSYLVRNEHNGYLAEIGEYELLGEFIIELAKNKEKRVEYGKNSYNHLKENFSSGRFEYNYLTVIKKLLE